MMPEDLTALGVQCRLFVARYRDVPSTALHMAECETYSVWGLYNEVDLQDALRKLRFEPLRFEPELPLPPWWWQFY